MLNQKYLACLEACQRCFIDCQDCLNEMATQSSDNDCPNCCIQCSEISQLCIRFMVMDSPFLKQICSLCAEICDWCAEQCSQHDNDHCQRCAASCKKCAEECRKLAA